MLTSHLEAEILKMLITHSVPLANACLTRLGECMHTTKRFFAILTAAITIACSLPVFGANHPTAHKGAKIFAQRLVEITHARHSEVDEIGISTTTRRGCIGIASTDRSDIGEKCEKDDVQPMQTGKPFIEKEKDGFDVSLPLHDSTGKLIGVVGIGFKPSSGQTEASVTEQAKKIAAEMESKIPSKVKLFEQSR